MLAEYANADGSLVGGQWMTDPLAASALIDGLQCRFPDAHLGSVELAGGVLALHADGADNELLALHDWARRPGTRLLVHRPTRRAVATVTHDGETCFAKFVAGKKHAQVVASARRVELLRGLGFRVARLVHEEGSRDGSVAVWSRLEGRGMHELLGTDAYTEACEGAGRALRALHGAPRREDGAPFLGADCSRELARWIERTRGFDAALGDAAESKFMAFRSTIERVIPPTSLLHRDFHEKQVLIDGAGSIGLLDFDTLSPGEAELDVGNFLAHLELRSAQGGCEIAQARASRDAFLRGYGVRDVSADRLASYLDATRVRLACVYAFRPDSAEVVEAMLGRVGLPACER
jgi:aminoglycoside phosphotransferase